MTLMRQAGSQLVSFNKLKEFELPKETKSYKPVSHHDLVKNVTQVTNKVLDGYELVNSQYAVNKGTSKDADGNIEYEGEAGKFFGVLTYEKPDTKSIARRSIGIRNSYDKSMSVGWCFGESVFVCDNLMFNGEIKTLKKHTKNVWDSLEQQLVVDLFQNAQGVWTELEKDIESMTGLGITNNKAYQLLGEMWGNRILSDRQLSEARRHWLKPPQEEFEPRDMWSLYNSANHALKTTKADKIMNKHIQLHGRMMEEVGAIA